MDLKLRLPGLAAPPPGPFSASNRFRATRHITPAGSAFDRPTTRTLLLFCLLLTLLVATPLWGGEFRFNDLSFGDPPVPEMICIGGDCLPPELRRNSIPIASYALPRDWTHIGTLPISAPSYDFFRDRLFRIRYRIACRPQQTGCGVEPFWSMFIRQHPLEETPIPVSSPEVTCRRGTMPGGDVLTICRSLRSSDDQRPLVQIYDPYLMDEARRLANPEYQKLR